MAFICNTGNTGSAGIVTDQILLLNERAEQTLEGSLAALEELTTFQIPLLAADVALDGSWGFDVTDIGRAPVLTDITFNPSIGAVPDFVPTSIREVAAPADEPIAPSDAPVPTFPDAPTLTAAPDMPVAPVYDDIGDIPSYEDLVSGIPFPMLREIILPPVPDIDLDSIQFTASRPVFTGSELDESGFAYVDDPYDQLLIDETRQAILDMMAGRSGLPPAVENALFERAREREIELAERAVSEAEEEWASRGNAYPGGPLAMRVARVRQEAYNKVSQLNRDTFIEAWKIQIEQFRYAVAQGIALETLWAQLYNEAMGRKLQAARFSLDLAISVYNAKVARFQAEAMLYKTDAEVYRERLQGELAKVQVYAEQLRGQQIIGQLNQQDVEIYRTRVESLLVNAQVYTARIEGYRAAIESQRAKAEAYRAEIDAVRAMIDSNTALVQQYSEQVRAEGIKLETWRIRADVYGTKVAGWTAKYNASLEAARTDVAKLEANAAAYNATVAGARGQVDLERTRIDALTSANAQKLTAYQVESTSVDTRNRAVLQRALAGLERYKAIADIEVKNAEINISNLFNVYNSLMRGRETVATTLAQLAAGAMSAANVSASIGDSSSSSYSCSYNVSASAE